MAKYIVNVKEVWTRQITVNANSESEAIAKAHTAIATDRYEDKMLSNRESLTYCYPMVDTEWVVTYPNSTVPAYVEDAIAKLDPEYQLRIVAKLYHGVLRRFPIIIFKDGSEFQWSPTADRWISLLRPTGPINAWIDVK